MNTDYSYIRNLSRLCFRMITSFCVVVFVDHVFHQVEECVDIQVHVLGVVDIFSRLSNTHFSCSVIITIALNSSCKSTYYF